MPPTSADSLVVRVCSWNVAEVNPEKVNKEGLREWLNPIAEELPGVIIIGLQELDMSAKALIQEKTRRSGAWEQVLTRTVQSTIGVQYTLLDCHQLMGLGLFMFVAEELAPYMYDVEVCRTRTGFFNSFGNKGAVCGRFKFEGKSFCFINAHLAAHQSEVNRRKKDHDRIANLSLFSQLPQKLMSHDSVFWFGDLNYRLDMPRHEVVGSIASPCKTELMQKYDQLHAEMRDGKVFAGFTEPMITWDPTYKCLKGARGEYSEKRSPAYCDRILYAIGDPDVDLLVAGRPRRCVVCNLHCELDKGKFRKSGLKCHSCVGKKSGSKTPPLPPQVTYLPTVCLNYSDDPDVTASDHRPIHGTFAIRGVRSCR
eukprot:TRINITY_DN6699_c0_g4_i1.p1 TRINITY_DN6699_c0_g4~~TRINITY_DN6699_c0_g4_i1.p1  ORF type:complete len:378 (+),score=39.57 TRINITY_DN6699_c0_g4_i1:33-1136(+)